MLRQGGTHAFRSNLFAAAPTKRISTAIVAAMQAPVKKMLSESIWPRLIKKNICYFIIQAP